MFARTSLGSTRDVNRLHLYPVCFGCCGFVINISVAEMRGILCFNEPLVRASTEEELLLNSCDLRCHHVAGQKIKSVFSDTAIMLIAESRKGGAHSESHAIAQGCYRAMCHVSSCRVPATGASDAEQFSVDDSEDSTPPALPGFRKPQLSIWHSRKLLTSNFST